VDSAALWEAVAARRDCTEQESGARIGRVDLDAGAFLSAKVRRRMDRLGIFCLVASRLALSAGGLEIDEQTGDRVGTIVGTGIGPMESMEDFSRPLFEEGPRAANPAIFPNTVYNAATGQVAMHVGAVGPTTTVTAGHAAGASAIAYATGILGRGQADAMLAIGADTLTGAVIDGYRALRSAGPGGFALSEAGVALLLERRSYAMKRGAKAVGEVLGYGIAGDGLGVGRWDLSGHGLERAMRLALESAGLEPADIATVWSSLSGLKLADDAEQQALARTFGGRTCPEVFSASAFIGEPIGAGASVSAALAVAGWSRGERPGPALVNSSSLGGTHFSIVLAPAAAVVAAP
jgi:3-oxoacyl-[acyl-carrier-protein] synthase II